MPSADDKVRMAEFTIETGLEPSEIVDAGRRSMVAGKRAMTSTIKEDRVAKNGAVYVVKGPGGIVEQMRFTVTWEELEGGRLMVLLSIGRYLSSRPSLLGFIPVGPASVPALRSVQRFSESLRVELGRR